MGSFFISSFLADLAYAFNISKPIARPIGGGTALPTCLCLSMMWPSKMYQSGKPCDLAHSLTDTTRCWSGCKTRPCFPIGCGLVTVVEKNPSQAKRPYNPAQWLWRLLVCGKHQGMIVSSCLSGLHFGLDLAVAQLHTPRRSPVTGFLPCMMSLYL